MKNLQSQLRPPCPWVPQIWLVTELCLNFLINSVNKAEIDDLAAFSSSLKLEESSSLRISRSSAGGCWVKQQSAFSLVIAQGGLRAQVTPSAVHVDHITSSTLPVFTCWGISRWEKEASALILAGFAVKEESTNTTTLCCHLTKKTDALHCLVPSACSNTLRGLPGGKKVPLKRTIAAEIAQKLFQQTPAATRVLRIMETHPGHDQEPGLSWRTPPRVAAGKAHCCFCCLHHFRSSGQFGVTSF